MINLSWSDWANYYLLKSLYLNRPSSCNSISNSKEILIYWISSHIGINRNEKADSTAKSALDTAHDNFKNSIFLLQTQNQ